MKRSYPCQKMPNTKIAILKSESDSFQKYTSLLKSHQFEVVLVPTIDFAFTNLLEIRSALDNPGKYSGLIFTSPRSVQAVYSALDGKELAVDWSTKLNYCVGVTTFDEARSKLNLSTRGKETGNAQKLSELIIEDFKISSSDLKNMPFLFPCSSLKQDILPKNLTEASILLEIIDAYETVPHPDLKLNLEQIIQDQKVQYLVFFSPSGVNFSSKIMDENGWSLANKIIIAIGPSSARAITENGLMCHRICENPTPESLLECLELDEKEMEQKRPRQENDS